MTAPYRLWTDTGRDLVQTVLHDFLTHSLGLPPEIVRPYGAAEAVLGALAAAGWRPDGTALLSLIGDLTDDEPCWFDHHGYCQAHGWMATDPSCPHGRAKALFEDPLATATDSGSRQTEEETDA